MSSVTPPNGWIVFCFFFFAFLHEAINISLHFPSNRSYKKNKKKKSGAALRGIIPAVISVNVPSFHIMKSFPLSADGIK